MASTLPAFLIGHLGYGDAASREQQIIIAFLLGSGYFPVHREAACYHEQQCRSELLLQTDHVIGELNGAPLLLFKTFQRYDW
jgi:hypothetical protein